MLVHGAILPPRAALEAVTGVVRGVPVPEDEQPAAAPKGLLSRLGRKSDAPATLADKLAAPSTNAHHNRFI